MSFVVINVIRLGVVVGSNPTRVRGVLSLSLCLITFRDRLPFQPRNVQKDDAKQNVCEDDDDEDDDNNIDDDDDDDL